MKNNLLCILALFCASFVEAQNRVNNPSFEDTTRNSIGSLITNFWNTPTLSSPDLMNANNFSFWNVPMNIGGYQFPREGGTYYGIVVFEENSINFDRSEYIQNELKQPLIKDSTYCFQIYMSLGDSMTFAIKNKLGVYFSQNEVDSMNRNSRLHLTPQIQFDDSTFFTEKENWVRLNASFVAQGGERFMTIGRFESDTTIEFMRVDGGGRVEHQKVYYYLDDVYLGNCDSLPLDTPNGLRENTFKTQIKAYPNPTTGSFVLENQSNQQLKVRLFSVFGKEISTSLSLTKADGSKIELSLEGLPNGIYFLNVLGEGRESTTIKIVKSNY